MFLKKVAATGMVLSAVALATTETFAAGFQLTEQSVVTLGRAYAGSGITGDDVSAPFYNPAAMVFLPGTCCCVGRPSSLSTLTARPSSLMPSSIRYGSAMSIDRSDLPSV